MEIVASGDAMIYSFTNRRITVQANAKLYYKQQ
jgi:lipopolysaccharide export system protein LptA